jgi:hypothetical protein
MNTDQSSNRSFFSKISTHYDALAMVNDTSKAFFLIGGLQILSSVLLGTYIGIFHAAANLVGAFAIRSRHSRVAAVVLLALSAATCVGFLLSYVGVTVVSGGSSVSIIFTLLGLWAGARATEATYKLHGSLAANVVLEEESGT